MSPETWNGLEVHRFGDGPELADELLHLVLEGKKTATCWDAAEGLKGAEVGKPWAEADGDVAEAIGRRLGLRTASISAVSSLARPEICSVRA